MEIDQSEEEISRNSDALRNLTAKGPLRTSIAKLSGSSRVIPSRKDFYFYNNFQEFKDPVEEIDKKSKSLLERIGDSDNLFGKRILFPDDKEVEVDDDVSLDWLVNANDEVFERLDVSLDEFRSLRMKEEESSVGMMGVNGKSENGFQMVYGKKNKKLLGADRNAKELGMKAGEEVKVAKKVKPKIPFHIPTIPKPQDEYRIIVNNTNQPFEHVWLERSEDGSRFHPLEKHSALDFAYKSDHIADPVKPPPLELTPFKFVEEVKDLKQLALKLRNVNEFAVDLEHNQYRSFQGLTCLMQISTRTEDFIIDTLKLKIHIGPHLRELFKDPTKKKILHGANSDILWLQRDFGIYICNMFDTGQASRVLKMERYSLEYLLNHFCGVVANKEYQNADWRLRPLPAEMIKYAREDTHYLLYIYDMMRKELIMSPAESESSDPPLIEVYKRSYDICTQLYEKELLTESSYLHIYGLQDADLNAQQLAIVSGLCEWRDVVARSEDESTGYILPNRTLIEIAKQMPVTTNNLRRVLKSKHSYIERNLGSIVSIIRHSIQNAAAFDEAVEYLKQRRLEIANEGKNILAKEESEVLTSEVPGVLKNARAKNLCNNTLSDDHTPDNSRASIERHDEFPDAGNSDNGVAANISEPSHPCPGQIGNGEGGKDATGPSLEFGEPKAMSQIEVTFQTAKKPSRAFGAILGNSAKRNLDPDKTEQVDTKLEQIKSSVALPFNSFLHRDEQSQSYVKVSEDLAERDVSVTSTGSREVSPQRDVSVPATGSSLDDVIILDDDDSDIEEVSAGGSPESDSGDQVIEVNDDSDSASEIEEEDGEPMTLSDLSSSFEKCLPSVDQAKSSEMVDKSPPSDGFLQFKPFDYEAARKQIKFGEDSKAEKMEESDDEDDNDGRSRSMREDRKNSTPSKQNEGTSDLPQGRRRQAFPASGNRSATFR